MALPPSHTLVFVAGDALKFQFQIADRDVDDLEAPPVPRDLTGWTAFAQVRKTAPAATVEAEWEIANAPLGSDGLVKLYLSGPDTQPFAAIQNLVSDVQLTDPAGDPETVLTLVIQAAQDVSRE